MLAQTAKASQILNLRMGIQSSLQKIQTSISVKEIRVNSPKIKPNFHLRLCNIDFC